MIREVPAGEWGPFLRQFGHEHRAWLATLHVVDARGTVTRSDEITLKSGAASTDAVSLEFFGGAHSLSAHKPRALRVQETDIGAVQAIEMDAPDAQFIRLAFRATALPEQLDGLAPEELTPDVSPSWVKS